MTLKNDKIRDLTPLVTSYVPGESPTAEKLQGMIRQSDAAIEYIENKLGDLAGEEGLFNTWVSTLARNIGDFSKLNPSVLPNYEVEGYEQNLTIGACEHELDMIPVGNLNALIVSSLDSSIIVSQWKASVAELEKPGDWTIAFSYIENGQVKRGRKLVTHAPAEGGSVIFNKVTSGRGSSVESSSENTIPSLAQAEDGGPFVEIAVVDSFAKIYEMTLPIRTKMYDKAGQIVNFTASNTRSGIGLNSQHELPQFFFGLDGLNLDADDEDGLPQQIPLNLIKLYDWDTKKEVEGIIFLQASNSSISRKYQFILQTRQDVILNTATGRYIIVVPGNSIVNQLKSLADTVYGNTGIGNDMARLISHKNLIDLRTGSTNITNRSKYYGPSNIHNNDHSMYLHRDGFTDTDKGAGANILRGHLVIGNTSTGISDLVHENYNIDADSYAIRFGDSTNGPEIKYAKSKTYSLDHTYGGLPLGMVDAGLWIQGAVSDLNPARKNIFLEGDIRTSGNIVLGKEASDIVFVQGKVYINDEMTLIPRVRTGITGEEGKVIYDSTEKAPVYYNGSRWVSPWNLTGYATVIGDGVTSFGKYNGQTYATWNSALADVAAGGVIKVLPGTYNFLGNKLSIPVNVEIEGSGNLTIVSGTGIMFETVGANAGIKKMLVQNGLIGLKASAANSIAQDVTFSACATGIQITNAGTGMRILDNVTFENCAKDIDSANTAFIPSLQTVMNSAVTYNNSTVADWGLKDQILKDFHVESGTAVITFDNTLESAFGKGAFRIVGNGEIQGEKMLPVNVNIGIGGHINIKRLGTTGTAYAGVKCYDASYNTLGTRYFIMDNVTLAAATMDSSFYHAMMYGTTGFAGMMFPVGTRFVKPILVVSGNDGGIAFDAFEVENMTYARVATWS